MDHVKILNHNFATIGWGALLIWWGIVILVNPLTIGMGAIGTGLIMLAVNGIRLLNGVHPKPSTTLIGMVALIWGAIDGLFNPRFEFSFAILLIVIGLAAFASLLTSSVADG